MFGYLIGLYEKRELKKQLRRIANNDAAQVETAKFFADRLSLYRARCMKENGESQPDTLKAIILDAKDIRRQNNMMGFDDPVWSATYMTESWAMMKHGSLTGRIKPSLADEMETILINWAKKTIGEAEFNLFMQKDWSD